ncbi:MAG: diguanylate cyclase, partial [bacterium]|nr:diguanylate cyclase [bacterium]
MAKKRWMLVVLAALLAVAALSTWGLARWADHELRATLLLETRLVAQALNLAHIAALTGTAGDMAAPDYQRLKDQFAAIRAANAQCRFVYLLGRTTNGTTFIFLDSEPVGSVDY